MKYADAIATHKSASKGPDAFCTIKQFGDEYIKGNRGRVRSAMVLLIAAGHVRIIRKRKGDTALFQCAPTLTEKAINSANNAARVTAYDKITPRMTRAQARKILKDHEHADVKKARPRKG